MSWIGTLLIVTIYAICCLGFIHHNSERLLSDGYAELIGHLDNNSSELRSIVQSQHSRNVIYILSSTSLSVFNGESAQMGVSRLVGNEKSAVYTDDYGLSVSILNGHSLTADYSKGYLYYSDPSFFFINKLSLLSGYVSNLIGTGQAGCLPTHPVPWDQVVMTAPTGITFDFSSNVLFFADSACGLVASWDGVHATPLMTSQTPFFLYPTSSQPISAEFTNIDKLAFDRNSNRLYFLDSGRGFALVDALDSNRHVSPISSTIFNSSLHALCGRGQVVYSFDNYSLNQWIPMTLKGDKASPGMAFFVCSAVYPRLFIAMCTNMQ